MSKLKRKLNSSRNSLTQTQGASKVLCTDQSRVNVNQTNIFEQLMNKAEYIFGNENNPNELGVDQAVFQRNLSRLLKSNHTYPEVITDFIDGVQKHLEDHFRLKWSLMPTTTSANCKSARDVCQDSLIHLLLGIEILQEKVAYLLLEKMAEISACNGIDIFDHFGDKSLPCMILSQFRWLNKLVNSEALSTQMLELVKATPNEVQRDIISLLPDIISDADHPNVACSLSEILLEYQELSVTILEALSNLNIKAETLNEVRKRVLGTLPSANIQDLPIIVKFILQNLEVQEAFETINELRNGLDFTTTFHPVSASTPLRKSGNFGSEKGSELLTLDAIRLALKFQKPLCDVWIKVIESIKSPGEHRSLDFIVLLVLHSLGTYKKTVESLIRNKIKCGYFSEALLQVTFRCHSEILKEYFSSLLILADVLLRSIEPVVSLFGSAIYQKSFISFDTFNKQEIIGNLVTHVGNGTGSEVDAALDTLVLLAKQHSEKMVLFGTFIKNIMDHLDSLTLSHIRKVYSMLGFLVYQGNREGAVLQDDICIIIRKQLTNNNSRYQKMGIIGALMAAKATSSSIQGATYDYNFVIRVCCCPNRNDDVQRLQPSSCKDSANNEFSSSTGSSQSEKINLENQKQAMSLLNLVGKSTANSPEAYALYCDELSRIIVKGELDKKVEEWISDTVMNDFQEEYILEFEPDNDLKLGEGIELKYGLDENNEGGIALNIYNLVKNDIQKCGTAQTANLSSEKHISPVKMCSHFRLLRICEQSQHGSILETIDALLGCPISLPELYHPKFASLSVKDKHLLLNILFFTINWFREVINAFAPVNDVDVKIKVCERLQLVVKLQDLLHKYIQDAPNYIPPLANFDCENAEVLQFKLTQKSVTGKSEKGKKEKKTAKKRKKKSDSENQDKVSQTDNSSTQIETSTSVENNSDKQQGEDESNTTMNSCWSSYQPYFRELDMDIFVLLQIGLTFEKTPDLDSTTKELCLHPPELKFLLEDLVNKLHHCLFSSSVYNRLILPQRHAGFSNLELYSPAEAAAFCTRLFPNICQLLEDCSGYFQNIIAENDGVIDGLKIFSEESQLVASCMQLIFQLMSSVFSWKGFATSDYLPLLEEGVKTMASRLQKLPDNTTLQKLIGHTIEYLAKFSDSLVSLFCSTALIKLMESVIIHSKDDNQKKQLVSVAENFLKYDWPELNSQKKKGAKVNQSVQILLEAYLCHSDSVLKSLEHLSTIAIPQLVREEDSTEISQFKTLNKSTFNSYYKIMLNYLAESMKNYYANTQEEKEEELMQWSVAVKIFHILVNLIKVFDGRSSLSACLKYGRQFLDLFLRHGMPLLDQLFRTHQDDVQNLLKNLQMSTRFMQHVCSHSKVLQDIVLTKQVPFLKKSLESFVYRVKVMLAVNKCEEAFWLGNLKNRDLQGEEILSQATAVNEEEDADDSAEVASDPAEEADEAEKELGNGGKSPSEASEPVDSDVSEDY